MAPTAWETQLLHMLHYLKISLTKNKYALYQARYKLESFERIDHFICHDSVLDNYKPDLKKVDIRLMTMHAL
jgi:hypothetical protein